MSELDLRNCRKLEINIEEKTHSKFDEPDDAVREIVAWIDYDDMANEEYAPVRIGSVRMLIFDEYHASENGIDPAQMIDAYSQEAVDVFYSLYSDDLFNAAFEDGDIELTVRDDVHTAIIGDDAVDPQEHRQLLYFPQVDLADLTEDETILVLGRLIEMYTDYTYMIAIWWKPEYDNVKLNALKRLMTKVRKLDGGGILFAMYGGYKLPHHPQYQLTDEE